MIEDALFLGLGFCVAVVLALACLPLLWARALRLTKQRLELLVPWSREEIDAERDGLRAQAAVERRRLEQDVDRSRSALAVRDVAYGTQTVSLVRTEVERDALRAERTRLIAELSDASRAERDAEGQRFATEKALHDADRRIETDAVALRQLSGRFEHMSELAEQRRGTVAALETRVAGLLATIEDHEATLVRRDAALAHLAASREATAAEHQALVANHAHLQQAHEGLLAQLASGRDGPQPLQQIEGDEFAGTLKKRIDALEADLMAHAVGAPDHASGPDRDPRLRQAIAEIGDHALALFGPAMPMTGEQR